MYNTSVVCSLHINVKNQNTMFHIQFFLINIFNIFISGYLRDKYGIYDYSFHLAAGTNVACGILMLLMIPFLSWHRRLQQSTHEPIGNEEPATIDQNKEDTPMTVVGAEDVV